MINKIDDGSGVLNFEDFQMVKQIKLEEYWKSIQYQVMGEKSRESDLEIHFKDTFRAFSKDNDGNFGNNVLGKSRKRKVSNV